MVIRKVIAGIELLIKGQPEVEIREANPVSEIFFAPENTPPGAHQIHIQLSDEPLPAVENKTLVFVADPVWSMRRDDLFCWIVLHPPAFQQPLWVARFDHDFSQGIVYCSEHLKEAQKGKFILYDPVAYPLDQILLMHYLSQIGGMLIHATGWLQHSSGWVFAGKSGAGKSTLSNLIVKATGSRFLSDDRIIIRKAGDEFLMYGTPWPGEAGYAINESAPLKGIFFLGRGTTNTIKKLKPADAILRLMPVVSIPLYDRNKVELMVTFFEGLMEKVPMFDLAFVPDEAVAHELMSFVDNLCTAG